MIIVFISYRGRTIRKNISSFQLSDYISTDNFYKRSNETLGLEFVYRATAIIMAFPEGDYFVVMVADNRRGIAKAHLEKIFTKYVRISSDVKGTGVGLHLVREFVNLSGGRVTVEGEPDNGSVFKVYLRNLQK